jgi:hypothetical protein
VRAAAALLACALPLAPAAVHAQDEGEPAVVRLTLRDHRFMPDTVAVPAGRPLRIELVNEDDAPETLQSDELGVEAHVSPHGRASASTGPLKPGRYGFFGALHPALTRGVLEAVGQ